MVAAASAANAHDFIMALPDGYETVIGERGAQLSGGQRQRIAIARALLRDAPILVLDEALSSVDAENEAVIQQALDRLMTGRTTLILAHRLSSVIGADRILVLDDGAVVQSGRHAELIAVDGPYRDLMGPQLAEHDDAVIDDRADAWPACAWWRRRPTPAPWCARCPTTRPRSAGPKPSAPCWASSGPGAAQLGVIVLCGIGRVLAFIGVGVFGALIIGAVRAHAPTLALIAALLLTAPLAGLLHWLESWLAHAMAYQLLAEMRIDLFRKLDALAPAYLLRRRSGDLVALATQDVETVEYFFAHTVAPAIVAVLVPAGVLLVLLLDLPGRWRSCWRRSCSTPAPRRCWAGGGSTRWARRRAARWARSARTPPRRSRAWPSWWRSTPPTAAARRVHGRGAALPGHAAAAAGGPDLRRPPGWRSPPAWAAWRWPRWARRWCCTAGFRAGCCRCWCWSRSSAFLPVSEIAQVGRQLGRHDRLDAAAARGARRAGGDPGRAAGAGRRRWAARRCGSTTCRSPIPAALRPALSEVSFAVPAGATVALVGPSGAGKTTIANLLLRFWDPDDGAIRLDGVDLRELTLDGLRGRIALVAQDTYLFNDTLERERAAGAARTRRRSRSRRRWHARRWRSSSPGCRRGWRPASASAACSCPAASGSAWRSPAPS